MYHSSFTAHTHFSFSALGRPTGDTPTPSPGQPTLPGIVTTPEAPRPWVLTDGITGWLEGRSPGQDLVYRIGDSPVFTGWESTILGNPVNRGHRALQETLYPWGTVIDYLGVRETLVLHQGRRVLSLAVEALLPGPGAPAGDWAQIEPSIPASLGPAGATNPDAPAGPPGDGTAGSPVAAPVSTSPGSPIQGPAGVLAYAPPPADQGPLRWEQRTESRVLNLSPGLWVAYFAVHLCFATSDEELAVTLGWVDAALGPGGHPDGPLGQEVAARRAVLALPALESSAPLWDRALAWTQASARSMLSRDYGLGIWAGLPWFRDNWGRDTFIALPGTLYYGGRWDEAREVLVNFARFQNRDPASPDQGRIPNRVNQHEVIYNTVDGTPWLIRELWNLVNHSGNLALARELRPVVEAYLEGSRAQGFEDADGLLRHADADTWMDARIAGDTPWSPRGPWAVEIQALWYTAQGVAAAIADLDGDPTAAARHRERAERTREAFHRRFVHGGILADRLDASGRPDPARRPNALMAALIPFDDFVDPAVMEATTRVLTETLVRPHGIMSLDPAHPWFHPVHEYPGAWHKDAAYHNGTIWGWNTGFTVSALCAQGWQDLAWELTAHLCHQVFDTGTPGTLSELVDALASPEGLAQPSGTYSQAWSVAELVRSSIEDYLGFRPRLVQERILLDPALPSALDRVAYTLPYGRKADGSPWELQGRGSRQGTEWQWEWSTTNPQAPTLVLRGRDLPWVADGQGTLRCQARDPGPAVASGALPRMAPPLRWPEPGDTCSWVCLRGPHALRDLREQAP